MLTRDDLLKSPYYHFDHFQNEIFRQVSDYMEREKLDKSQLAERIGVSKYFITKVLRGDFNASLKSFTKLFLAIGIVPQITYASVEYVIVEEKRLAFERKIMEEEDFD